ncbi:hypothetical protein A1019T_01136 [Psychrobacter pasteurii]|uniref:Uncharacterized protein n=1 Tax=Psychrobacter pasteurii TaxID=1945520 RepID=A0A1R4EF82_9GAMM|nr:hypothetical protein [Psychrobacter pasteurii]SJM37165.1 hypothetical protein A1019T_01136 [Psychrobacter pasteurii]
MNKVLLNRFGTSPRLQLACGDWLQHGMHAKTVKFDIGQGGEVPQVNWEDRSAAIALIKHGPTKALASLLLWGSNEHWNWSDDFDEVVRYLTNEMLKRCDADDRQAPKGCSHSREELAYLMSRMTLHFELYNLWDLYSLEGQLLFSGINVPANTYRQVWKKYQDYMLDDTQRLALDVEHAVQEYRHRLGL